MPLQKEHILTNAGQALLATGNAFTPSLVKFGSGRYVPTGAETDIAIPLSPPLEIANPGISVDGDVLGVLSQYAGLREFSECGVFVGSTLVWLLVNNDGNLTDDLIQNFLVLITFDSATNPAVTITNPSVAPLATDLTPGMVRLDQIPEGISTVAALPTNPAVGDKVRVGQNLTGLTAGTVKDTDGVTNLTAVYRGWILERMTTFWQVDFKMLTRHRAGQDTPEYLDGSTWRFFERRRVNSAGSYGSYVSMTTEDSWYTIATLALTARSKKLMLAATFQRRPADINAIQCEFDVQIAGTSYGARVQSVNPQQDINGSSEDVLVTLPVQLDTVRDQAYTILARCRYVSAHGVTNNRQVRAKLDVLN